MAQPDPAISLDVAGDEMLVTMRGTSYAVASFKREGPSALIAKRFTQDDDDPCITLTSAEFLEGAWKVATDKARELGGIVET